MKSQYIVIGAIIILALLLAIGGVFFYKNRTNQSLSHGMYTNQEAMKGMDEMMQQGVKIQTTFENDKVKIVHYHFDGHAKIPMHNAPNLVAVWLTDGHLKLTSPDGTTKEMSVKAGQTEYEAAESHAGENLADQPLDFISVQLKNTNNLTSSQNAENAMNMSQMTSPGLTIHQEISNDKVEVFRYNVAPGAEIPWHTPPAGVQAQLTDGKLQITFENGKTMVANLQAGTAVWFESMRHKGKNIGDTPIEFLSIRLK